MNRIFRVAAARVACVSFLQMFSFGSLSLLGGCAHAPVQPITDAEVQQLQKQLPEWALDQIQKKKPLSQDRKTSVQEVEKISADEIALVVETRYSEPDSQGQKSESVLRTRLRVLKNSKGFKIERAELLDQQIVFTEGQQIDIMK
ncbi:MAG: hypothetical protein H7222_10685 [Methylotenera sp.]|nr:hypothetical protein [Oligoflexia bacterium]